MILPELAAGEAGVGVGGVVAAVRGVGAASRVRPSTLLPAQYTHQDKTGIVIKT
jgi:hypothetical protein